jgi:hypothetical protein
MKMLMHQVSGWGSAAVAIGHETDSNNSYNLVLGGMLDFEMSSVSRCETFLKAAADIEREGGSAEYTLHDKAWIINIRPTEVAIEYEFDDMGDDWKAVFPLEQVCRAVKGWMQFLQMPESSERRLIVDLDAD